MISRRALFGKLNLTNFRAIESATVAAKSRGNSHVELAHWIHQLLQFGDGDLQRICAHFQISGAVLEKDISVALSALPRGHATLIDFSQDVETAIERAWMISSLEFDGRCVRGAWLMLAILQNAGLRRVLNEISPAFALIPAESLRWSMTDIIAGSPEDGEAPHGSSGLTPAVPGEASAAIRRPSSPSDALERYCTDLTAQARAGQIDPVIGRASELRAMVDILLRRRQNNPLLTGEAGVGKTAVVEGLARAIAEGTVPLALADVRLLSLDIGALLAGASMRGEFEARLKSLLDDALTHPKPCILFIDEIHTLVGAGGQTGTGDAANLLKPALARGRLRVIGATTWSEYKRHIEKDPALVRRFQTMQVLEPLEASAIEMVRGLVPAFAAHHGVLVLDEAVRASVVLSHRYLPERQLPDKAIGLLDTACARVAISLHAPPAAVAHLRQRVAALAAESERLDEECLVSQGAQQRQGRQRAVKASLTSARDELVRRESQWAEELALVTNIHVLRAATAADEGAAMQAEKMPAAEMLVLETRLKALQAAAPLVFPHVDEAAIAAVVADWTGIPAGRMFMDEVAALLALRATLERRVVGQSQAIATISERVRTARAQLTDPTRPIGVFLLAGPSGVGKTETALALAEAMYGGEHRLITLNMSEFQESHSVATLRGAPPGYVGYGEGGLLTEAVRRQPYSAILLDEAEKAHPDVLEAFYQVFDKGWMEDGEGRRIDFRNTTILLTDNTGGELISARCAQADSPPDDAALRAVLQPALRRTFSAAFLGRLCVVPYRALDEQALRAVVAGQLARLAERMHTQHRIELDFTPRLAMHIIDRCGTHESGARLITGFIEQHLLPVLSACWLDALQQRHVLARITADVEPSADRDGAEVIVCRAEEAPTAREVGALGARCIHVAGTVAAASTCTAATADDERTSSSEATESSVVNRESPE
jgi:type VI secretion system protein VasG